MAEILKQAQAGSQTTGRFLVLLGEDVREDAPDFFKKALGMRAVSTADAREGGMLSDEQLNSADAVVFDELGVAVVSGTQPQLQQISSLRTTGSERGPIALIEPERFVYTASSLRPGLRREGELKLATSAPGVSLEYLRGYQDGVNHLIDSVLPLEGMRDAPVHGGIPAAADESRFTWGLSATNVDNSTFSGLGIRVAVLDTGIDFQVDEDGGNVYHLDFQGRQIVHNSFVPDELASDGDGHGTHCIGTACGPADQSIHPRYGIAHEAEMYAGKVLTNKGWGIDEWMLAGISWAIRNNCQVVSMSIAGEPGGTHSQVFEAAARRALGRGVLIVAAAGNDSRRNAGILRPVSHPANCPSIMAVGGIDSQFRMYNRSNQGLNTDGGKIDIVGPAVDIYSSYPMPKRYERLSGTSMATPHVAGIAALLAEANPSVRGQALWNLLVQTSKPLDLPEEDVGAGLVQAP
jgi:subtilisin family serine protease